jgi:hypothetical protein
MWDYMSSALVEVYRRYVAFVYLYETVHRHVTEGCNSYRFITNDVMSLYSTKVNDKTVMYYLTVIYMCFHFVLYR